MAGFGSTDIQELKDIVRIGQVSKVNAGEMTARVQIPEPGHSHRRFKDCKTTANRGM